MSRGGAPFLFASLLGLVDFSGHLWPRRGGRGGRLGRGGAGRARARRHQKLTEVGVGQPGRPAATPKHTRSLAIDTQYTGVTVA